MASKEELEKLTVVQIREKLKSRKLPITGSKSELVNRLFDSLMVEEKLLEGPGGENIDLSGVNMDEVLGLDDDKDTNSSPNATNEGEECEKIETKKDDELIEEKDSNLCKEMITTDEKKPRLKIRATSESKTTEILAKREERFGTTAVESGVKKITKKDEEEAKEKRANRFGLISDSIKTKKTTDEDSKMLKRAERFGLPLKRGGGASEITEVLAKREKRFGPVVGSGDMDTKKESRAKRFGVVS